MSTTLSLRWKVRDAFKLYWQFWGEDTVVYNSGSGDTHQLEHVAATALQILENTACSPYELAVKLSDTINHQMGDDFFEYIEKILADLSSLGLIVQLEQ
jgi:PqqD family protein of HPr-rel-A system